MTRYVFRNNQWVERKSGEPLAPPDRIAVPYLWKDVTYKSPLSGKEITSRSQRREEMKIHNVREVAPDEFKPVFRKKENAIRNGGEWDPNAGKPADPGDASIYKRLPVA